MSDITEDWLAMWLASKSKRWLQWATALHHCAAFALLVIAGLAWGMVALAVVGVTFLLGVTLTFCAVLGDDL